ncbi:MAG TPA: septal ring lytic transglycosylase RlpA family protein [Lysobacter sp.]|nr:septal ring lytic transglycosylase RlpA family protein [Lysobacter sp.]
MRAAIAAAALLLAACSGTPTKSPPPSQRMVVQPAQGVNPGGTQRKRSPYAPAQEDPSKRGDYVAGGLYAPHVRDSAPDDDIPDVDLIPEPEVKAEPRSRYGNRDYAVLGTPYRVLDRPDGYVEQGLASFYGRKFHGRRTSSLEVYDMYAFSAAHKTLPLPSFARVTNLANGKSVIVRVNDRGPFHPGRVIDLSYAAAVKLGVVRTGTARVEVRALTPGDAGTGTQFAQSPPTPTPEAAQPSALDRMVSALPIASANAGERPASAGEKSVQDPYRFDMRQDGKAMTADEFDAWMKARQVRVATGRAGKPDAPAAVAASQAPAPQAGAPAPTPANASSKSANGITLQVASFAARGNAERALAMLEGAGIRDARLLDATAAGQKVWRLRVGPIATAAVAELSAKVQGLGFGPPNVVRE